jgi:ubiquitin C-terminal hydrolase
MAMAAVAKAKSPQKNHSRITSSFHFQPKKENPIPNTDLPAFLQRKIQFREASSKNLNPAINYKTANNLTNKTVALYDSSKLEFTWKKIVAAGPGLSNLGNTCFLNATLQCLLYTSPLANYLLSDQHVCKRGKEICILCEFVEFAKQIHRQSNQASRSSIVPQGMVARLKQVARHFRPGRQEDAHEYLRFLLESLNKCLYNGNSDLSVQMTTAFGCIFGGKLCSTITCSVCGTKNNTYDPFLDVSLELKKGVTSLASALSAFSAEEQLSHGNRYSCSVCKKGTLASKQMSFDSLPPILTLHLKRFSSPFTKITRHITFSPQLVISRHKGDSRIEYDLYGVLVHEGFSCSSGHYFCYVKAPNELWYEMNDSTVRQVSIQTVLSTPAYILLYQRKQTELNELSNNCKSNNPKAKALKEPLASSPAQLKKRKLREDEREEEEDHFTQLNRPGTPIKRNLTEPPKEQHFTSPTSGSWKVKKLYKK